MKRKVSLVGQSSLVVTLPYEWVRVNRIKKGDELDVSVRNNSLVIDTQGIVQQNEAVLDVDGFDSTLVHRFFNAAYSVGYDLVEIKYSLPSIKVQGWAKKLGVSSMKAAELMQTLTDENIGMEIISQKKGSYTLSDVTNIREEELDISIRRIFYLLKLMADYCLEALKNSDAELINNIFYIDISVNKFTNYCQRILSKRGHNRFLFSMHLSRLLDFVELMGDELKDMAYDMKDVITRRDKALFIKQTQDLKELMDVFYDAYYSYSKEKVKDLFTFARSVKSRNEFDLKSKTDMDAIKMHFHTTSIIELTKNAVQRIIEIKSLPAD